MGHAVACHGVGRQTDGMTTATSATVRAAFDSATAAFVAEVSAVDPAQWSRSATDPWTVRQLVAHTVRGMIVMSDLLDAAGPVTDPVLADAAAYFRSALTHERVHAGIVQRAVDAADQAPDDLVAWACDVAVAARTRAAATPDDVVVVHFAGPVRFVDYLGTRVTELVLHTVDLQLACGRDPGVPVDALAVVTPILLALADRADPLDLALALSGRVGPRACNVLG